MQVQQEQIDEKVKKPTVIVEPPADDNEKDPSQGDDSGTIDSGDEEDEGEDTQVERPAGTKKDGEGDEDDDGPVVVTIDGEESEDEDAELKAAPPWVQGVRQQNKQLKRKVEKMEAELAAKAPKEAGIDPTLAKSEPPKLEDFDYDESLHTQKVKEWNEVQVKVELQKRQRASAEEVEKKRAMDRLSFYNSKKEELSVEDYESAEELVQEVLTQEQLGILLNEAADNPALVMYALGKNPSKLKAIASQANPIKYIRAITELELKLRVSKRKPAVGPEKKISSGTAAISGTIDSTLEKLRAKAERTGLTKDMDAVLKHRKRMRQKG